MGVLPLRNQFFWWLSLVLALFCLPLMWLARVVYFTYVEAVCGVGMNAGCPPCARPGIGQSHPYPA